MNNTFGGSKDIKDITREIANSAKCGTFCLRSISLKLTYAMLLTINIDRETINIIVNIMYDEISASKSTISQT